MTVYLLINSLLDYLTNMELILEKKDLLKESS